MYKFTYIYTFAFIMYVVSIILLLINIVINIGTKKKIVLFFTPPPQNVPTPLLLVFGEISTPTPIIRYSRVFFVMNSIW